MSNIIDLSPYKAKQEAIVASEKNLAPAREKLIAAQSAAAAAMNDDGSKSAAAFVDHKASTARAAEVLEIEVKRLGDAHESLVNSLTRDLIEAAETLIPKLQQLADDREGKALAFIANFFPDGLYVHGFSVERLRGFLGNSKLIRGPRSHAEAVAKRHLYAPMKVQDYFNWLAEAITLLQTETPFLR